MASVMLILVACFMRLVVGNDLMSPSRVIAPDKTTHQNLHPRYSIRHLAESINEPIDAANDNINSDTSPHYDGFNVDDHLQGRSSNWGTNLASKSHHSHNSVPWNDLSFASSNSKSNGHQGFFQYARMPAEGAWEFGYRRGNHEHFTERHEHAASHHFKSKVRWGDKLGGYGEHYFDLNHKGIGDDAHVLQRNQAIKSHFSAPNYAAAAAAAAAASSSSIVTSNLPTDD